MRRASRGEINGADAATRHVTSPDITPTFSLSHPDLDLVFTLRRSRLHSTHPATAAMAAGVLRCVTRFTTLRLPSAFPTGPRASLVPRLVHTDVPAPVTREEVKELVREGFAVLNAMRPPPPPAIVKLSAADFAAFREEIKLAVMEAVKEESKKMTSTAFERYERLTTRVVNLEETSATRHAQAMSTYIKSEQRVAKISFRIGVTMIGLAAASQYQGQISSILMHLFGVQPSPPSAEEVAATVREELPSLVNVAVAQHFEQEKKNCTIGE